MRVPALALLLALVTGSSGCGYHFAPVRAGGAPAGTIAVASLENDSYEFGVERQVADAIQRAFLRRGGLAVVDDPEAADLVVRGSVQPLQTSRRSFSSVRLVLEYEVTLALALEVARRDGTVLSLPGQLLSRTEIYQASADVEVTRKNRREALRRAAEVLADRLHDALLEVVRR